VPFFDGSNLRNHSGLDTNFSRTSVYHGCAATDSRYTHTLVSLLMALITLACSNRRSLHVMGESLIHSSFSLDQSKSTIPNFAAT